MASSRKTTELLKLKLNFPQRHGEISKGDWRTCLLTCKPPHHCQCFKEKTKVWRCRVTEKIDYSQTGSLRPGESLYSPRGTCSRVFMEEVTVQVSSVPKGRQRWEKYRLRHDRNTGDVLGGYLLETSSVGNSS